MMWLLFSYKSLEELSQTRPGKKKSGFVLKEETLKLAKPVLFLLKLSLSCVAVW